LWRTYAPDAALRPTERVRQLQACAGDAPIEPPLLSAETGLEVGDQATEALDLHRRCHDERGLLVGSTALVGRRCASQRGRLGGVLRPSAGVGCSPLSGVCAKSGGVETWLGELTRQRHSRQPA